VILILGGLMLVVGSVLVFAVVLACDRDPAPSAESRTEREAPRLRRAA
jgi:hypothetical protein